MDEIDSNSLNFKFGFPLIPLREQEREREKSRENQFPLFWFEWERKDIL